MYAFTCSSDFPARAIDINFPPLNPLLNTRYSRTKRDVSGNRHIRIENKPSDIRKRVDDRFIRIAYPKLSRAGGNFSFVLAL